MKRARRLAGFAVVAGLFTGCGGGPGSTLDAGGFGTPDGSRRPDGGPSTPDTGPAASDTGVPPGDAGVSPGDAGVSPGDAGGLPPDLGPASDDAGLLPPDAALARPDAGILPPNPDAGLLPPDAALLRPDAGVLPPNPDAGLLPPDAALLRPDAGVRPPNPDAGLLPPDAALLRPDAAVLPPDPDAGLLPPDLGAPPEPDAAIAGDPPLDPVAYGGRLPAAAGAGRAVLTVAGLDREIEVYVPPRLAERPALVLALHGTWGWGTDLVGAHRPQGFEDLADQHGFVLLAPDARRIEAGDWDQHEAGVRNRTYWETLPTDDPSRGADPDRNPDLLFIRAVIAEARRTFGVDPRRVYVVGHSNGGFFTQHVATVLADRVAAFASASAGLVRCPSTATCRFQGAGESCAALRAQPGYCACDGPEKPVPVPVGGRMPPGFLFHSTDDDIVSVYYSCELEARMEALGHTVESHIRDRAGGHWLPRSFSGEAWAFVSRFVL